MNIMNRVTWKAMWKNRTRTIVTIIGVILSAAMFTAVTTMVYSSWMFFVADARYDSGDYFLQYDYLNSQELDALKQEEDITALAQYDALGLIWTNEESSGELSSWVVAAADQTFFDTMPVHLAAGRLPQNSSEIVVPKSAVDNLKYYGMDCTIGNTVTLEVSADFPFFPESLQHLAQDTAFTRTYTVVGYIEGHYYHDIGLHLYSILTLADGSQEEALWHRAFVKCPVSQVTKLQDLEYGLARFTNSKYLAYHGFTDYANYNSMVLALAAVLCGIIMVGSVSLIYNAFSISVAERTKQFGLLTSVGATRKQLRRMVRFEALFLWAIGVIPGLGAGYLGIHITLTLLRPRIDMFFSAADGTISLIALPNLWAFLAAAVITLATVLLSAAIPAARASRVDPITAIRQQKDYSVPKKALRSGKLTGTLFGLPGLLARKYYTVSHKKYRATVISLTVSIFLFITAASFSQALRETVRQTIRAENFDIYVYARQEDKEDLQALRQQSFVADSAYTVYWSYRSWIPDEDYTQQYLDTWGSLKNYYSSMYKNMPYVELHYLEDAVFEAYLRQQGLSPADYMDPEDPMALVVEKNISTYYVQDQDGNWNRYTYRYDPLNKDAQLMLFGVSIPEALQDEGIRYFAECSTDEHGEPQLTMCPVVQQGDQAFHDKANAKIYTMKFQKTAQGQTEILYYEKGSEEPAARQLSDAPQFRLGATVSELPFGIFSDAQTAVSTISFLLPLSAAPEEVKADANLAFTVSNYAAAKAYLDANFTTYQDELESMEANKTLLLIINVFSYGFIGLISLICVANVFNTLSTNIALRRRDFGMLRSTGFRQRDIRTMMCCECLSYGFQSIALGLPLGLLASYGIYCIDKAAFSGGFQPPWTALAAASASVFLVVFATMFYAVSKLRKDNPIEAIRMENT